MSLEEFQMLTGVNAILASEFYSIFSSSLPFPVKLQGTPNLDHFERGQDYTTTTNCIYMTLDSYKVYLYMSGQIERRRDLSKLHKLYNIFIRDNLVKESLRGKERDQRILELEHKLTNKYIPGERVYVMKNDLLESGSNYKIGRTKDLQKRIANYNTSSGKGGVCIVYEKLCCDSKLVEAVIHFILDKFRSEKNHEYFHCTLEVIKNTIDHVISSLDDYRNDVTDTPEIDIETETVQSSYFKQFQFSHT